MGGRNATSKGDKKYKSPSGNQYVGWNPDAYCLYCSRKVPSYKKPYCDKYHQILFEESMLDFCKQTGTVPSVNLMVGRAGQRVAELGNTQKNILEKIVQGLILKIESQGYKVQNNKLVVA